ncbi:hypothetical protein CHUAL_002102 [Chamberlinius hualienensis]
MAKVVLLILLILTISYLEASERRNVNERSAFDIIEAESFDYQNSVNVGACLYESVNITNMHIQNNSSMLGFKDVNFGSGAKSVDIRLNQDGGFDQYSIVQFHLDSMTGTELAAIQIQRTDGDFCHYSTWSSMLIPIPIGIHDLYLTFVGNIDKGFPDVDWIRFNATAP